MSDPVVIQKTPGAIKDYSFTWEEAAADAIADSTWTPAAGITIVADSFTNTTTVVRLSGGTDQVSYRLRNDIEYTSGQTDYRWITVEVGELAAFTNAQKNSIAEIIYEPFSSVEDLVSSLNDAQIEAIIADLATWAAIRDSHVRLGGEVDFDNERKREAIRRRIRKALGLPLYSLEVEPGSYSIPVRAVF